jgi:putative hydrolase of the HAD superfamily
MNIRAVIFDFSKILCFPPTPEQWQEAAAFAGTGDALHDAFWRHRLEYDAGGDAHEYWKKVAADLGVAFTNPTIEGLIEREIAFWSTFDSRVLSWADELRTDGIRTAMLSNLPRPLGERLRATSGFFDHFDHLTLSYELGVNKPAAAIYEDAIAGVRVTPSEALFLEEFVANQLGRYPLPRPRV